jgi:hypothetical protein
VNWQRKDALLAQETATRSYDWKKKLHELKESAYQ